MAKDDEAIRNALGTALDNTTLTEEAYDYGYGGELVKYSRQVEGQYAAYDVLSQLRELGYDIVKVER